MATPIHISEGLNPSKQAEAPELFRRWILNRPNYSYLRLASWAQRSLAATVAKMSWTGDGIPRPIGKFLEMLSHGNLVWRFLVWRLAVMMDAGEPAGLLRAAQVRA